MTDSAAPLPRQTFAPKAGNPIGGALKLGFDLLAALAGLAVLAPVFAVLGWQIRRDSKGPVFYRGRRAGRGRREFRIAKFRTMYECEVSYNGARITAQDDEWVTPFGRRLLDTKLNELPQLWNVLKGEMSLVGPRPEDPEIARSWPEAARAVCCWKP